MLAYVGFVMNGIEIFNTNVYSNCSVKSVVNVMRKWVLNCFYVIDNHIFLKEMVEDF